MKIRITPRSPAGVRRICAGLAFAAWPRCSSSTTPRPRRCESLTDGRAGRAPTTRSTVSRCVARPALEATADDVLAADGFLLGTPANFGYMSGALKHFFDSTFLYAGGALSPTGQAAATGGREKPFGLYVHGRYDTTGAVRSVLAIVGALPWRQAAATLEVLGEVTPTTSSRPRSGRYDRGTAERVNRVTAGRET